MKRTWWGQVFTRQGRFLLLLVNVNGNRKKYFVVLEQIPMIQCPECECSLNFIYDVLRIRPLLLQRYVKSLYQCFD